MPRFYLPLALIIMLLFTVMLLIFRAQPNDDRELRQLLLPEGCAAPCFMGIQPGVTTVLEALQQLPGTGWVKQDNSGLHFSGHENLLTFKWTGKQPAVIDVTQDLRLLFEQSTTQVIKQISFHLRAEVKMGQINLILGKPSGFRGSPIRSLNIGGGQHSPLFLDTFYEAQRIDLLTLPRCPVNPARLLDANMIEVVYYDILPVELPGSNLKAILRDPDCR